MFPLSQITGPHHTAYQHHYLQVNPSETDAIGALEAASFLKRSNLPDAVLSKIWDLSDPGGKGYLDRYGFFVALKLISLAQNGLDVNTTNLSTNVPPPNMGEPQTSGKVDWTIKSSERAKYNKLFESMSPQEGKLPSTKVKPVMLNSKLPLDILGRVWDLSDIDNDGSLDQDEFALAMHLIYKALENNPVPTVLPAELIPPSKRKKSLAGAVAVLPPDPVSRITASSPSPAAEVLAKNAHNAAVPPLVAWVVSAADKTKYDAMFVAADLDADGFVNGAEIKDLFLQSGLPQSVLAHIWNLCDIKHNGQLSMEQFALAMYFVQQKIQGVEPPPTLLPEMVPPSLRARSDSTSSADGGNLGNNYGNPELEMIGKEIEELSRERHQLEAEISQKEADIVIRNGEIKSLLGESVTLAATLRQLELQRGEAQKRLDDLDTQKSSLVSTLSSTHKQIDEELEQVTQLKKQLEEQQKSLQEQELELKGKQLELKELRQEESGLEQQVDTNRKKLDQLNKQLQETLLHISQSKAKLTHLQEQHRQLNDAITQYDEVIASGDVDGLQESALQPIAPYVELEFSQLENRVNDVGFADFKDDDPFKSKDPFTNSNGFAVDPFAGEDPFQDDVFKSKEVEVFGGDPFANAFANDPFKDSDPFGGAGGEIGGAKPDGFDPFGGGGGQNNSSAPQNGDLFGSDPFASGPAVAPRTESPTPALPPKKSKQPPPRPAPPKSSTNGRARAAPPAPDPPGAADPFAAAPKPPHSSDPFASAFDGDPFDPFGEKSSSSVPSSIPSNDPFASGGAPKSSDAFVADFADFDSK